jgi:hypothetical protein
MSYQRVYISSPTTPRYPIPEYDGRLIDPIRPRPIQLDHAPYTNMWSYTSQQTNRAGPSAVDHYQFPYGMVSYYTTDITRNPYPTQVFGDELSGSVSRHAEYTPMSTPHNYYYTVRPDVSTNGYTNQSDYDQLTYRTDMLASYSRLLNRSRYALQ